MHKITIIKIKLIENIEIKRWIDEKFKGIENFKNRIVGKMFAGNSLENRYFPTMLQRGYRGNIQPRDAMLMRKILTASMKFPY